MTERILPSPSALVNMAMSRRNAFKYGGLFSAALVVPALASCSKSSPAPAQAITSGGVSGTSATSSQESQQATSVLKAAYGRPIESLNPYGRLGLAQGTQLGSKQIFDTLVIRNGEAVEPQLVAEWQNPDANTWVLKLRTDVKFHDGSPMTADDVKASFDLVRGTDSGYAKLWKSLRSVEATDQYTVTVKTTEPMGTFLSNATLLYVVPANAKGDAKFFDSPVGSGPYAFESLVPDQTLVLRANSAYWGPKPSVGRIEFPYIAEVSARLTAIQTGEVDVAWTIPPDQLDQMKSASGISVVQRPSLVYWILWFNSGRKPFDDMRVRQALWHAADVEKIVKDLFGDTVKMSNSPIPSTTFGYAEQKPYSYDPGLAKQLLTEAGYPGGFSTSLKWPRGQSPQIDQWAQSLVSYWAKVGVTVKPLQEEEAPYTKETNDLDYDMMTQTANVRNGDADYGLARLYTCDAGQNGFCSPELDTVLKKAGNSTDQDERKTLYAQACAIVWDQAAGIFPGELVISSAFRSKVKGFEPDALEMVKFNSVSLTA